MVWESLLLESFPRSLWLMSRFVTNQSTLQKTFVFLGYSKTFFLKKHSHHIWIVLYIVNSIFPLKSLNKPFSYIPLLLFVGMWQVLSFKCTCVSLIQKELPKAEHWKDIFATTRVLLGLSEVLQFADYGRSHFVLRSVMAAAPSSGKFSSVVLNIISRRPV